MRLKLIYILLYMFPSLLHGQVFCSQHIPTVFFGPQNVILKNDINPASIYINEIENGINRLTNLPFINEIKLEIEVLKSIKEDWISVNDTKVYSHNNDIVVTEFFSISGEVLSLNNFSKSIPKNCLYGNPQDCISYHLIKKNKIKVIDDYGNKFIEGFHHYYDVGLSEHNKEIRFYRKRNLNSL